MNEAGWASEHTGTTDRHGQRQSDVAGSRRHSEDDRDEAAAEPHSRRGRPTRPTPRGVLSHDNKPSRAL